MELDEVYVTAKLKPQGAAPLVRIGRDNDGGYLIDERCLEHTDLLMGLGVNDDWSFDQDFLNHRPVPLHAYDASISAWDFLIEGWSKVALVEPINAWNRFSAMFRYLRFFNKTDRVHHYEYIGIAYGSRRISLTQALERDSGSAQRIFLKIDIEHSEYRILKDLIAYQDRIEGLVIEFHDADLHERRIEEFVENFDLHLCHIHPNNSQQPHSGNKCTIYELTFTRHPLNKDEMIEFPNEQDMPCSLYNREQKVLFG